LLTLVERKSGKKAAKRRGVNSSRTQCRRLLPTLDALLAACSTLHATYRIKSAATELKPTSTQPPPRRLTSMELFSLVYHRYRPVMSCAMLVWVLMALALYTLPADEVVEFFRSPTVQAVLIHRYNDGKMDGKLRDLAVLEECSMSKPVWSRLMRSKYRRRLFGEWRVGGKWIPFS